MRYLFGVWSDSNQPLSVEQMNDLFETASKRAPVLAAYSQDKIFSLLGRLSRLWANESYEGRVTAMELLPEATGFSPEMTALALAELPKLLEPAGLERKLRTELRGLPPVGTESFDFETRTGLSWQPVGTVLHVLAGNVFLGGPGSLLEGLITKNVNILKMSSGERVFLPLFLKSIQEVDLDGVVSRSIALIDYPSSRSDLIQAVKSNADGIVVWGGEQAVNAYREGLPVHTRLIAFGPKLSFGLVTSQGLASVDEDILAKRLALDVSIWDQNACTAPQLVYVEGEANANRLAEKLALALDRIAREIPPGPVDLQTAVEIRKLRSVAEIAHARGTGRLYESSSGMTYTVTVDRDVVIEPSPLHRTIRIVPVEDLSLVTAEMKKLKGFIQTVGLVAAPAEQSNWVTQLASAGAVRIVEIGRMAGGEIDDPHDGQYDLSQYVNFVVNRLPRLPGTGSPVDLYDKAQFGEMVDSRLRRLIECARRSEFYGRRLLGAEVEGSGDLPKIPILTREELEANMPPFGRGLETATPVGGYVSRSGGSTGEPKYSIYDGHDWEQMISHAVSMFHAAGLRRGDRLANCFLAGDLYGSFVSFDHINVRVGALTFGFAGQATPEFFANTYKKLGFNAVQGVPAFILPLLREAKRLVPGLRLEKVIYAGAPMNEADRTWLKEELGVSRIASVIGANDGGQFAFQCEHQSGKFHHLVDDFNFVEIVDEEGLPVGPGETGRILITSLLKYAYPLIRYEIGDLGRIVQEKCKCGSHRRVIEYLGRADNTVSAGLLNFSYADCLAAIQEFPVSELQVHVSTTDGLDCIRALVESESRDPDLGPLLRKVLLERLGKLGQRVQENAVRFEVEVVLSGSLPRNARTGKLKQVVDERL